MSRNAIKYLEAWMTNLPLYAIRLLMKIFWVDHISLLRSELLILVYLTWTSQNQKGI